MCNGRALTVERHKRLERLDNELTYQVRRWRFYPLVKAERGHPQVSLSRQCELLKPSRSSMY